MPAIDTKEVGLEIGATVFKYFLDTEYLHYGLFSDGLAVEPRNLAEAQARYAGFLKANIPAGTKTILDVGCGTGRFAVDLINAGYAVDCVSPGSVLTDHVRALLGDRGAIYNCRFEEVTTPKRYDLVLFSESFQYIDPAQAFTQARGLLNPCGHILICDVFKTDPTNTFKLGGGHDLAQYAQTVARQPLRLVREQDITRETAGTVDLANRLSMEVLQPTYRLALRLIEDRYPRLARLLKWKYRKKMARLEARHFSGERTGENYMRYKRYMLYLYRTG
jgi:SAM-dependent methyltransferase